VTDVTSDVLAVLRRAEASRLSGDDRGHLSALLELAALAAAGRAVPTPASVRVGGLIRDRRGQWRRVLNVSAFSVTATNPPPESPDRVPWHWVTGFCGVSPPPGTVTRRQTTPSLF
jgi:hypothetical protein